MDKKSVLITGTSTGIGHACAIHLDSIGFKVFAGVRKEEDMAKLASQGSERLHPVILDVTNPQNIEQVVQILKQETEYPLFGIVNNAGIGGGGVVEVIPMDVIIKTYEVNVFGLYRITKACLPLLRKNKGRIINMGSITSYFSTSGHSSYSSSKFAVRAITDSLRLELEHFGLNVSLIAPGAIESKMWEKSREYRRKMIEEVDPELMEVYWIFAKASEWLDDTAKPIPAMKVAKAVEHALIARKPKYEYLVGKDARMIRMISRLPKRLVNKLFIKHIKKFAEDQ